MKRETSLKEGKGYPSQKSSKQNSQAVTGNDKSAKRVSPVKAKRDSAARFVERANEHMLRAWESIHKNGKERKAS